MRDDVALSDLTLDYIKVGILARLPTGIVPQHLSMSQQVDGLAEMLSVRLVAYFLGTKRDYHETVETVEVPADWWEHVKQRWCPVWLQHRWPVRVQTITVERHTHETFVCPHIDTVFAQDGMPHIEYLLKGAHDEG